MAIYVCNHCNKEIYRYEPFVVTTDNGDIFCETECALLHYSQSDEEYNHLLSEYCEEFNENHNPLKLKEVNWEEKIFDNQDCQEFSGVKIFNILTHDIKQ